MTERVLTLRELNRATLARQMLLTREKIGVTEAVARLVGVQAQVANPPYIGLWTRLARFARDDLSAAMERKEIVRAAFLRSTLHLVAADDYLRLWPAVQPALARALNAFFGKQAKGVDTAKLVDAARTALAEQPRPFTTLRALLSEIEPDRQPEALAYVVRSHLPLVQVFPAGRWGYGGEIAYALAEPHLAGSLAPDAGAGELLRRYLAAFGPASVRDAQTWTGLTRLKEAMETLRPGLRTFRDERGTELFDLPDAPLPDADPAQGTPDAPVRFLPEYDNLLLAHADRTRIIADAHRPKVFLSAARVRATFLVDGRVRGAWKIEREKAARGKTGAAGAATLVIEPFAPLSKREQTALTDEGERLVRFIEDGAADYAVRFAGG